MKNIYQTLQSILILLICSSSFATLQNSGSQIPPNFTRATLPIPSSLTSNVSIRVKIFPHTLRNDWRHGKADNPLKFKFIAEKPTALTDSKGKIVVIKKSVVKFKGGEIFVGDKKLSSPISFSSEEPIKVERYGNESKSSAYTGSFKLHIKKSALELINTVDMPTYLKGVVPSESASTWPIEALKAQALAARSYALYHLINSPKDKDWDVDDTARYQVYSGVNHTTDSTDRAVDETRGEVITYNDEVIVAFFHAYSGGWTDSAKNIFDSELAHYCQSVKEVFEREELKEELPVKSHWVVEWTKKWNKQKLQDRAFNNLESIAPISIEVIEFNDFFDTAKTIVFTKLNNSREINFLDFRKNVGWTNFNSYHFNMIDQTQDDVTLRGYGWGHHVGMSQWGAFMMAKRYSATYKEIIKHYYKDIEIKKI